MKRRYISMSLAYLALCASQVLFLSSTWRQWSLLHIGAFILALYFAGGFIHAGRKALYEIFKIEGHYEVITKQGANIYAQKINRSDDGKSFQIINKEAVTYIYTSEVQFIDDVTSEGKVRKTLTKFLFDNLKGDK
jgi:hypothetical protein